jgi:hypothetical protein
MNENNSTESLGTALPKEMARVRDEVLPQYVAICPAGFPAATLMRNDLDRAARALAEGDVVAMLAVYKSLKGFNA